MSEAKLHLVWNPDNVRDAAESVGISNLNDEAVRSLSQDVEYRISQVIVDAMRFMHAGKRTVLGTQDISQALKVLDVEPLYGYESTRPLRFGEASLGPGQPLFYVEDEEVDFEKLINAPLPKVPRDTSFTAHWLAVDGVQPSISQNPTTAEARANELVPKGPGANPALAALAGNDHVSYKPQVKHILSKELIFFFDKIKGSLLDEDSDNEVQMLRASALESLRSDPGLSQLGVYMIWFIGEKVTHSLSNLFILQTMMELASALVANESLFLDPYITNLVPAVLTCLIGMPIRPPPSDTPPSPQANYDLLKKQYHLRDYAASLLSLLATKYEASAPELRARTVRSCLECWLTPTRSLQEHYGAILGIVACGRTDAVRKTILPNMKLYETVLVKAEKEIEAEGEGAREKSEEVKMMVSACVRAVAALVGGEIKAEREIGQGEEMNVDDEMGGVGDEREREREVVEYLGVVIGKRIVAARDRTLNRAILEARDKERDGEEET